MAKIIDPAAQARPGARLGGIARLRTSGPSDAGARGMIGLGQDLGAAGAELERAQRIEEDRVNGLRAEDAFNRLRARQGELTYAEGGFATLKGAAAVTKPLLPEYTKRFDDAEREIAQGLSNDNQRARFKVRADVSRLQYQEEMLRHLAREGDVYAKEVYDGTIAQSQRDAVSRWENPNDVAGSIARIQNAVNERADRYGWPKDYRDAVMREEASKVHASVVRQALASGSNTYAQRWYEQNKDDIDSATATVLQAAVREGGQKDLTAAFTADFLAQRDNPAGLKALETRVLASGLDETRKNIVHGRILGRLDTLELRAEQGRLRAEAQIGKMIGEANANTFAGMPSTIEQLTPIFEASKGTPMEAEARQMVNLANATAGFSRLPPAQQAEAIMRAEAQVRADPANHDRRALDAWKSIHAAQKEQLATDPVGFAVSRGLAEPAVVDLSQPAQAAAGLNHQIGVARAMQQQYGAPLRPLTQAQAKVVSQALDGAGWKERRDYLGQLFQATGGDIVGYSGIMAQIAPDHPVTALAGEYAAKGRGQASEFMLAGEAILRPPTKADGKPDSAGLLPLPPETVMRAEFDADVREAYAGRPHMRNTAYQATRAIYAKLASDKGLKDTKTLDTGLWEQAFALATGGVERYNGAHIPLPYGMDKARFVGEVRRRTEDMEAAGVLPAGVAAAKLQDLPLEPIGDGRYAFRVGDGLLVSTPKGGKPQIKNADGTVSTERTITIEADGRHYVLPTIIAGKQLSEDQAVAAWRKGTNAAVGEFGTAAEANRFAQERTARLSSQLAPRPVVLDFNQSAAFRSSGYGGSPAEPAAPRERPAFAGPDASGMWR